MVRLFEKGQRGRGKKWALLQAVRGSVKRAIINLESTLSKKLQLSAACIQEA